MRNFSSSDKRLSVSHTLSGHFGQEANLLGIDSALRFLHSGRDDFLLSTMFSPALEPPGS
jgi:hypothetical protein